jgi:membrane-associated phospholipid phosphatase
VQFSPAWREAELYPPFDRRSYPAYSLLGIMAACCACLCASLGFSVAREIYTQIFGPPAMMVVGGWCLRRLGKRDFAGAMETMGLVYLQATPAFLCIIPLAAISGPWADATLSRWDALMGFDWLAFNAASADWKVLWLFVYKSVFWQPALVALSLFFTGRSDRGWHFVTAAILSLMVCGALFAFWPALGPAVYHGIPQMAGEPFAPALTAIREGYRVIDNSTLKGVISFPSYHGASATIFAWALWPTRLRWPVVILNVAMAVSAIVIGPHYLIDILAGAGVAVMAVTVVQRGKRVPPEAAPAIRIST